ncbi:hypothetical protein OUZ56_015918 [Daphnia magna]|uniref:Uncharacterized protein n=1 Tax=Daphnia magna TaxID=35525 RepID=A0ABR0AP49_9CRUS|nr:hypothetical protein OUZ56_015918 [Daphnia magna]
MLVQLEIKRNNQFALIEKWTAEGLATVCAVNSSTCFSVKTREPRERTRPMLMTAAQQVPHDTQDTPERKRSPRGSSHVDRLIVKKEEETSDSLVIIIVHSRGQHQEPQILGLWNLRVFKFSRKENGDRICLQASAAPRGKC